MPICIEWFLFMLILTLLLCLIFKLSEHFKLHYKKAISLMVACIFVGAFVYRYWYFVHLNSTPSNQEAYQLKEAHYYITIQDDGSANIEHIIFLKPNNFNLKNSKRAISYIFTEAGSISKPEIWIDDEYINPSDRADFASYKFESVQNRNIFKIVPPQDFDGEFKLRIVYNVIDALKPVKYGVLSYYNTFERNLFSYNTHVIGSINFKLPSNCHYEIGAYSKDLYLVEEASGKFKFELNIPPEKHYGRFMNWAKKYDGASASGEYFKDFSISLKLLLYSSHFPQANVISEYKYDEPSVAEIQALNAEKNNKFSEVKRLFDYIYISSFAFIGLLIVFYPFIYWYYYKKKEERTSAFYNAIWKFLKNKQ